jgi:hypothetical protein
MLLSALASCCSSREIEDPTQDGGSNDDKQAFDTISRWSLQSSETYASSYSVHSSTASFGSESRAVTLSHAAKIIAIPHRSILRKSADQMPHLPSYSMKQVHWKAQSIVDDERRLLKSSLDHINREIQQQEQADENWHRGKSPIPVKIQVKRPPSVLFRSSFRSIAPNSPSSPIFVPTKNNNREVLYPVVSRPRRAASIVDVFRHKQALLGPSQQPREESALSSYIIKRDKRQQEISSLSPLGSHVDELRKSLGVLDGDSFDFQLSICVQQENASPVKRRRRKHRHSCRHHHGKHTRPHTYHDAQEQL